MFKGARTCSHWSIEEKPEKMNRLKSCNFFCPLKLRSRFQFVWRTILIFKWKWNFWEYLFSLENKIILNLKWNSCTEIINFCSEWNSFLTVVKIHILKLSWNLWCPCLYDHKNIIKINFVWYGTPLLIPYPILMIICHAASIVYFKKIILILKWI